MKEGNCKNCGKHWASEKSRNQKFCSYICKSKYYNKIFSKKLRENPISDNYTIIKICPNCKESFKKLRWSHQIFCSRKCLSIKREEKYKNKIEFLTPSYELGYFLGAIKGDGHVRYDENKSLYQVNIGVKDKDFIEFLKKQTQEIYPYHIRIWEREDSHSKKNGVFYGLTIHSKDFCKLIKDYNLEEMKDEEIIKGFLRGFFDAEGSMVIYSLNIPRLAVRHITLTHKDYSLILLIIGFLNRFNIKSGKISVKKGSGFNPKGIYYVFKITGKENLINFKNNVGFSIQRKQKKLEEALNTYQKW